MRKELYAILLFFLVILSSLSLLSYSGSDPCLNNAKEISGNINNIFGIFGAYLAGGLIGLFGIGAFLIPPLLLLAGINFLKKKNISAATSIAGGIILIIMTGAIFSVLKDNYIIFGTKVASGGIVGMAFRAFFVQYANTAGAIIIFLLLWTAGFILATGCSIIKAYKAIISFVKTKKVKIDTSLIKHSERRKKAKRIAQRKSEGQDAEQVKINSPAGKIEQPVFNQKPALKQEVFQFAAEEAKFSLPSVNLLDMIEKSKTQIDENNLSMQAKLLEKKLNDFGVTGKVTAINPGPVITTFEYEPSPGVKINKIANLSDDLALALSAISIRIVAPIPGRAVIGIEIPNNKRETVYFKEISTSQKFIDSKSKLTLCLGKNIAGEPIVAQLDKMPHLLIAGATGSGKSVALNTMITSILYKASPEEVRMIMIDPKRIELSDYNGIPHLIVPVVTDVKKATNALCWAVREMERRYELLAQSNARNLAGYNKKIKEIIKSKNQEIKKEEEKQLEPLPQIVIIIDELADLMMVASKEVEVSLARLAQMARAAGIHIILATQRPSVDVLTGVIKANFPTRMTFQVSSKTDSRTIIDANGAENLLGNGDMLFMPPSTGKLQRIHGAYISEAEITRIVVYLKKQGAPDYDKNILKPTKKNNADNAQTEYDEKYNEAVALVAKAGTASISMVQRHLRIGYNRAARIIEVMEQEGVIGPADGVKPREVLVKGYEDMG
ncbi:MAG: DNA translocase FtsK 4TM domain-containing protein [Deltaproteobacteria bacterium]|nr:DNA translocase FtsK 4TM domain-containing protein [Deltaproteobacteria bacterium]